MRTTLSLIPSKIMSEICTEAMVEDVGYCEEYAQGFAVFIYFWLFCKVEVVRKKLDCMQLC